MIAKATLRTRLAADSRWPSEVASDHRLEHLHELFIRRRRMLRTVPANAAQSIHDLIAKGLK